MKFLYKTKEILISILFFSLSAYPSADHPLCVLLALYKIHQPPSLGRSPQEIDPHELLSTGELVSQSKNLSSLAEGDYLYLITSKDQCFYSVRTPNLNGSPDGQHLATHRSLFVRATEINGSEPLVIAAGEFKIRNKKVAEVNNRSGSFRGKKEHLDYAKVLLKHYNLNIEPGTEILDASHIAPKPSHLTESQMSALRIRYSDTPGYRSLLHLNQWLYEQFPHPTLLGQFDSRKLMKAINASRLNAIKNLIQTEPATQNQANQHIAILNSLEYILKTLQNEGPGMIMQFANDRPFPGGFKLEDYINLLESLTLNELKLNPEKITLINLRTELMKLLNPKNY